MNHSVILSSVYWGPLDYYSKLISYPNIWIDGYEHYIKQTYRNRCMIASPNGVQALTVPIVKPDKDKSCMRDIKISDHGNWRHLHWNALEAAYRNSPFFEYYADDFLPFYTKKWEFLFDFNEAIRSKICELIDISPNINYTLTYGGTNGEVSDDFRGLTPKAKDNTNNTFVTKEYYQVFKDKHGFIPNLSIADLLFNMGPESILVLR